jgi:hypothetical protein
MAKHIFKLLSLLVAGLFWLTESLLHYLFFHADAIETVPADPHEMWMRVLVVVLMLIFGAYIDHYMAVIRKKEREKADIYEAMLYTSHNILNNFLNQMQYVRIKVKECEDLDPEVLETFDAIVDETSSHIRKLEKIPSITQEDIKASVQPRS